MHIWLEMISQVYVWLIFFHRLGLFSPTSTRSARVEEDMSEDDTDTDIDEEMLMIAKVNLT